MHSLIALSVFTIYTASLLIHVFQATSVQSYRSIDFLLAPLDTRTTASTALSLQSCEYLHVSAVWTSNSLTDANEQCSENNTQHHRQYSRFCTQAAFYKLFDNYYQSTLHWALQRTANSWHQWTTKHEAKLICVSRSAMLSGKIMQRTLTYFRIRADRDSTSLLNMMMMKWCLMSSDVSWHIKDKLRPMPKHGSI